MMENESQQKEQTPKPSEQKVFVSKRILQMYVDVTVRGMIAFFTLGMFSYFVLYGYFGFQIYITLPIIFIGSIFMSPLLAKIRLGEKVQDKYDNFLREVIFRINKWQGK